MNRRKFLSLAAGLTVWPLSVHAVTRPPALRRLRLKNAHTGETFDGPYRDDGGYLRRLVESVRAGLHAMPHYVAVREDVVEIAQFYADLQVLKHGPAGARERACGAWYARNRERFPNLAWWEFAAACGSSLPVFALIALGSVAPWT